MDLLKRLQDHPAMGQHFITDGVLTCAYQDLPALFETIAQTLQETGVDPQMPLAVECENSVPTAILILFLLQTGRSFLPLPWGSPEDLGDRVPPFCRHIARPLSLDPQGQPLDLAQPQTWLHLTPHPLAAPPIPLGDRGDRKLYMRTSGSTGTPKVVMHRHDRLQANGQACVDRLQLNPNDRIAIPVPLFHMYGLGAGFLPGVWAGACIDLQKGANLLRYIQREEQFNPNVAFLTPIFCETLIKGRRSSRPYRLTVAAGDRVRPDTFTPYESRFGCLVQLYGSTEMGAISAASPQDSLENRIPTVGLPMADVEMRLTQSDTLTPEDRAQGLGELWCRRQSGCEGYLDWQGQPLDLGQWDAEGWFYTKDYGRIQDNGRLEVWGRCDYSLNRDGLLVFFRDVEQALESLPTVATAVVVAKGESQRGKGLVAYCVPQNPQGAEGAAGITLGEALRKQCFDLLPKRAVPDRLIILPQLPLLPNGKIDRQTLTRQPD